jgi:hypothetical protein
MICINSGTVNSPRSSSWYILELINHIDSCFIYCNKIRPIETNLNSESTHKGMKESSKEEMINLNHMRNHIKNYMPQVN